MTAPLPPHWLSVMPETRAEVKEYAEEYAKLAVREALERAEDAVDSLHPKCSPAECAAAIRAMLEDYK